MSRLDNCERALLVELFFKNSESIHSTFVEYRRIKKIKSGIDPCSHNTLLAIVDKFRKTGNVGDLPHDKKAPVEVRVAAVANAVMESGGRTSTRLLSNQLNIPRMSIYRILSSVLKLHPYKPRVCQLLTEASRAKRVDFCELVLLKIEQHDLLLNNILWTDEASFYLHDIISVNNVYFWADDNPQLLFERPLASPKITVWVGFNNRFLLEPYFFDSNVTSDSYCTMILTHVIPLLKRKRLFSSTVYQQDGAPAHTSHQTINLLKQQFGSRLISRNCELTWPPYSPDLAPPDYFLWGYLKSRVYSNGHFQNLVDLKSRIATELSLIQSSHLLQKVCDSFPQKLHLCLDRQGDHV
jgi:hypothetical protein